MTMQKFVYSFAACAMLLANIGHASPAAERPLRQSLERLEQAWNTDDAAMWAGEYWPDGELVNILGGILPNPTAIRDRTAMILAGPFKGSHFESTVRRIRFLGADVAVVDIDIRVTKFHALPPGAVASEPGVLLTRMKHVYQHRAGVWKISLSQNTAVLPSANMPLPAAKP